MDGTVGLEGNGPKSGRSRVADRILCSGDPVALDTVQAEVMGLDPATIRHLATCAGRGIGTNDLARIDVRGMDLAAARVPFLPARHNAVSSVETLLRRSALKRLFFNTPVFDVCLFGAKLYYRAWTRLQAEAHWARIRAHPSTVPSGRACGRDAAAAEDSWPPPSPPPAPDRAKRAVRPHPTCFGGQNGLIA
jgi:hypothetical protein